MKKISELDEGQLCKLVDNRWKSSESIFDLVRKTYETNLPVYKNEPAWLADLPRKKSKVRANRIFVNVEAVINSLIANPPKPTILPGRDTPESKKLAIQQEKYFQIKYDERNTKEVLRKSLRNLYFSRFMCIKVFWDAKINDFNSRSLDPRKIRVGKNATKEDDSEFAIEQINDSLLAVMRRFPAKKDKILQQSGLTDEDQALIDNPEIEYKEAWIRDHVIFKYNNIILGVIRNPYWDWDGLLMTPQEQESISSLEGESRRAVFSQVKNAQTERRARMLQTNSAPVATDSTPQAPEQPAPAPVQDAPITTPEDGDETLTLEAYYFNHFDQPRKPYIFATVFNNENSPVGQTDMITQAIPLQEDVDETKRNITENAKLVNGQIKVDSTVMSKEDAQRLRYETGGVIWGKGVAAGVTRETGEPLPAFVLENLRDSRQEIDDIMASSSAFKGVREGQETKGGRLALIEQSFLRLNEFVQVVDYVSFEMYNWFYQLAKVRYTEHHYAKTMGREQAAENITLIQDDFENGSEVRVIGGKTLPEDRQFKYEQAQQDMKDGVLSPVDYFEVAGYDSPAEKAKNRVRFNMNPAVAVGIPMEEMKALSPVPQSEPPKLTIAYAELPPDGKVQLAAKAGIMLDPKIVVAEEMQNRKDKASEAEAKAKGMQKSPIQVK